jgi:hypothetical protein
MDNLRIATVFLFLSLFTQVAFTQEISFGVKSGINISKLTTSDERFEFFPVVTPHGGLYLRGRIKNIALQSEFLLNKITTRRKHVDDYANPQSRYTERIKYMSIPVLAKVYFMDFITVYAGPQFNILRAAERQFDPVFSFQSPAQNVNGEYFPWDISIAAGAGVDLRMGFSAEIRYLHGVQNIYNVTSGVEQHSRVWQLSVGWNFLR